MKPHFIGLAIFWLQQKGLFFFVCNTTKKPYEILQFIHYVPRHHTICFCSPCLFFVLTFCSRSVSQCFAGAIFGHYIMKSTTRLAKTNFQPILPILISHLKRRAIGRFPHMHAYFTCLNAFIRKFNQFSVIWLVKQSFYCHIAASMAPSQR